VDVRGHEVGHVRVDGDVAVEGGDSAAGGFGFGQRVARVGLVEENLTLEVALFDEIAVDKREESDSGARQQAGGGGSGGADADDGDMRAQQLFLARGSNSGEEHLPGVPFGRGVGRRHHR